MDNSNTQSRQNTDNNQLRGTIQTNGVQAPKQQSGSPGSINKELGPAPKSEPVIREKSDHVELSKETESIGMRVHKDQIQVAKELQDIGVYETGTSAKMPTNPRVKLPIPDTEVEKGLHQKIYSSVRWLAEWCIFQLKRAHMTLKVVRGKVMRVPYKSK